MPVIGADTYTSHIHERDEHMLPHEHYARAETLLATVAACTHPTHVGHMLRSDVIAEAAAHAILATVRLNTAIGH